MFLHILAAATLPAAPPTILSTTPALNDRETTPTLTQLRVTFDQPMNTTSWSWCGGGPGFPELSGKPFYEGDRTAVLPVRLMPEKTYMLSINCASAGGFKSRSGESAEPVAFRFTTGPGDALPTSDKANYDSWVEFRRIFDEVYSYRDRTGTDWTTVFDENQEWILRAPDEREWALRVATILAPADDPHLHLLLPDDSRISTHGRRGTYIPRPEAIKKLLGDVHEESPIVRWARVGDVGYLAIDSWDSSNDLLKSIPDVMKALAEAKTIILDVRANGGGVEDDALAVAGRFLNRGGVYARHRFRDPSAADGWGPMGERVVHPAPKEERYKGRVIVLQSDSCLSSNESFLLMMKLCDRVTFVGQTSGGSCANPRRFPLANGCWIVVPRWQSFLPDGTMIEGVGLKSDVVVEDGAWDRDATLEEALQMATADPDTK